LVVPFGAAEALGAADETPGDPLAGAAGVAGLAASSAAGVDSTGVPDDGAPWSPGAVVAVGSPCNDRAWASFSLELCVEPHPAPRTTAQTAAPNQARQ